MSDATFRVDNAFLENLNVFGKTTPKTRQPDPRQMGLPLDIEPPLAPFDQWLALGLYYLIDPKKPTEQVSVKLDQILEVLDFSRVLVHASGDYERWGFPSDDYARVKEAFHRLLTIETRLVITHRRRVRITYTTILSEYGYDFGTNVFVDQLPESRKRNVNRAVPKTGDAPPVYEIPGMKLKGVFFRMSEPMVMSMIAQAKSYQHMGYTIFPSEVFKFRRQLARNFAATRLLLRAGRQTRRAWSIGLDNLVKQIGLGKSRNTGRDRQAALDAVALLQSLGVVEGFEHDITRDMVRIVKADAWYFPNAGRRRIDELEDESDA